METEHLCIVHLIDMVTRKDKNIFRVISFNILEVLINSICSTLIPVSTILALIRRKNSHTAKGSVKVPGLAVTDIFIKLQGLILSKNADCIDTGIDTIGKRKVNNAVL